MLDTDRLQNDISRGLKPEFTVYVNSGVYEKSRMVFLDSRVTVETYNVCVTPEDKKLTTQVIVSNAVSEIVIPLFNLVSYTIRSNSNTLCLEVAR